MESSVNSWSSVETVESGVSSLRRAQSSCFALQNISSRRNDKLGLMSSGLWYKVGLMINHSLS